MMSQKCGKSILGLALASLICGAAQAGPEAPELEAKLDALGRGAAAISADVDGFEVGGTHKAGRLEIVAVDGLPFAKAMRFETLEAMDNPWSLRLQTNTTIELHTGDPMVVMFYARDVDKDPSAAKVQMNLRRQGGNYLTSYARTIELTPQWKKYYIAFPMVIKSKDKPVDIRFQSPPGEQLLSFVLGHRQQAVEIGGVEMLRYPLETSFDLLPNQPLTYKGRELDAPWRKTAQQRIEQVRKADLSLTVVDAQGQPVSDAEVSVDMTRHEFLWGTAVAGPRLFVSDEENIKYQQEVLRLFNFASALSGLKWVIWEKTHEGIDTLDWVLANGMETRGHVLVWPSWRKNPGHLRKLENTPAELEKKIEEHVRDIAPRFVGKVMQWDVVNEPYNNRDWLNLLGQDKAVDWFNLARELDPEAKLYLNENRLIAAYNELKSEKHEYFEGLIQYLIDHKAPIQGIGMQAHFDEERITDPEIMWQIIERYAAFGLEMAVTEFDVDSPDEQLQADVTRDVMTLVFSHPQFKLFQMWGFWDGQHDVFNAPIFRKDWSVKPSGQVYMDLVFNQWWTREQGTTDSQGQMKVRGFRGTYDVVVKHDGQSYRFPVTLTSEGTSFEARLDPSIQEEIAKAEAVAQQEKQAALAAVMKAHATRQPPKAPKAAGGGIGKGGPQARIDLGTPRGPLRLKVIEASEGTKADYAGWLGKDDRDSMVVTHIDLDGQTWAPFSFTVEPLADGALDLNLKGKFIKGGGELWVIYDNLQVEGATLANGDFEHGKDVKGWTLDWVKSGKKAELVHGDGLVQQGGSALRVNHDAKAGQTLQVLAGQRITIRGSVRLAPESMEGDGSLLPTYEDDEAVRGNDE